MLKLDTGGRFDMGRGSRPPEEVRFAIDSALEEAVSSEPVSGAPNSLLAGKIQGISSIRGSGRQQ